MLIVTLPSTCCWNDEMSGVLRTFSANPFVVMVMKLELALASLMMSCARFCGLPNDIEDGGPFDAALAAREQTASLQLNPIIK